MPAVEQRIKYVPTVEQRKGKQAPLSGVKLFKKIPNLYLLKSILYIYYVLDFLSFF